ncbi:MAG: hypothetical protein FWG25_01210 [Promicromonosporaceae bacterium]|nr:hypothetical protein [Promicromonosporaceae bacterium]
MTTPLERARDGAWRGYQIANSIMPQALKAGTQSIRDWETVGQCALEAALNRDEIAEWLFVNEQASEIARYQRRIIVENYKSGNSGNLGDLLGEMYVDTYYRQADAIIAGILGANDSLRNSTLVHTNGGKYFAV